MPLGYIERRAKSVQKYGYLSLRLPQANRELLGNRGIAVYDSV
jgi:hypothetical protein